MSSDQMLANGLLEGSIGTAHVIDKNLLHRVEYQGRPAENWAEIHPAWAILVDRPGRQPNNYGPDFGE